MNLESEVNGSVRVRQPKCRRGKRIVSTSIGRAQSGHSLQEVQDNVLDFAVLVPVRRHSQEGDDVGGRPAVHRYVDFAWDIL